ncbi:MULTISPECIES: hypothetical protein [Ehrlichia]|uniref:Uncharacterized protein n=1 Tax=Ehrlichia cf. muris str. EmCRT TaxID=1359167 RepID=A0A0F3ND44_9RICK|nr:MULTISPECIES: hypothetical protein [Ehrlichia]KJV65960.1 hypothetical protein EMUCRT_0145 [Ehrlichia cf. muris str. EmCRT]OUC04881.1 hypothetical protein DB91_01295 [Ehrlichia sp. Wisconsin_h]
MTLLNKMVILVHSFMIAFIAFVYLKKVISRRCCAYYPHYTTLYQDKSVEDIISNADQNVINEKEDDINKNTTSSIAKTKKRNTLHLLSNGEQEIITSIIDVDTGQVINQSTRHV